MTNEEVFQYLIDKTVGAQKSYFENNFRDACSGYNVTPSDLFVDDSEIDDCLIIINEFISLSEKVWDKTHGMMNVFNMFIFTRGKYRENEDSEEEDLVFHYNGERFGLIRK